MNDFNSILAPILPSLRRGVPINEVKVVARAVAANPESIRALLDLLAYPGAYTRIQLQKAAWVLHHAFQRDERGFMLLREKLGHALDAAQDATVLRELLKVLASPEWTDMETETQRKDALELAVGFLYVDVPVAVHYAALQIIQSRVQSSAEITEAIQAMHALNARLSAEKTPLKGCIERYVTRFHQKLARTKSPS